jgi:hypothetical protein
MAEGTEWRSTWAINEVGKEVFKNENKTELVALSRTAGCCPLVNGQSDMSGYCSEPGQVVHKFRRAN